MAFKHTLYIDLNEDSPSYGQLGLSSFISSIATFVATNIYLEVDNPFGDGFISANVGEPNPNPDIEFTQVSATELRGPYYDLPLTSGGDILSGEYCVRIIEEPIGNAANISEKQFKVVVCPQSGTGDDGKIKPIVEIVENCSTGKMLVQDKTDYLDYDLADYTLGLARPIVSSLDDVEAVTKSLQTDFQYHNAYYRASVSTGLKKIIEIEEGVCVDIRDKISCTVEKFVVCSFADCNIVACATKFVNELEKKACTLGGMSQLSTQDQDKMLLLSSKLGLLAAASACGDSDMIKSLMDSVKDIVGDNCTCENDSKGGPVRLSIVGKDVADKSVSQTDWIEVPDDAYAPSAQKWINPTTGEVDHPLRYRITATNHLEVSGIFVLTKQPGPEIIIKEYFDGIFAPNNGGISTVQSPVMTVVSNSNEIIYGYVNLIQENTGGKWMMRMFDDISKPASGIPMCINALFPLD